MASLTGETGRCATANGLGERSPWTRLPFHHFGFAVCGPTCGFMNDLTRDASVLIQPRETHVVVGHIASFHNRLSVDESEKPAYTPLVTQRTWWKFVPGFVHNNPGLSHHRNCCTHGSCQGSSDEQCSPHAQPLVLTTSSHGDHHQAATPATPQRGSSVDC